MASGASDRKRRKVEPVEGGEQCSLKRCSKPVNFEREDHVEIKITLPDRAISNFLAKCVVRWSPSGEALFHQECWTKLLKNVRARPKKKPARTDAIAAEEKALLKEAAKTAEFHDSHRSVRDKAARIAALIKKSRCCVVFTGAGVSTSAGIGDYRGKGGKWTQMDQEAATSKLAENLVDPDGGGNCRDEKEGDGGLDYEALRPTYAHEAIAKLVEMGLVKHVISQNCDGLHPLSGLPPERLTELHGNVFVEVCEACGRRYDRPFYVLDDQASQYYEETADNGTTDLAKPRNAPQCPHCGLTHRTGRACEREGCPGYLRDSIVNFGDNLDERALGVATECAQRMDVCLSMGSTMSVTPACELVEMGIEPVKLVIVNRQRTRLDALCLGRGGGGGGGERVYGDCDRVMREAMGHLLTAEEEEAWRRELEVKRGGYGGQRTQDRSA